MTAPDIDNLVGHTAVDRNGDKIGEIAQVYVDDTTGEPAWITVSTGLFGNKESYAPLYGATHVGDDVRLGVEKNQVKHAPSIDADTQLSEAETDELYRHYQADLGQTSSQRMTDGTTDTARHAEADGSDVRPAGHDTSGPDTDDAMTRSEERLHVGTETVESGRARLRKHVVTENVSKTVPVSHEEVRVQREPITDATAGAALD